MKKLITLIITGILLLVSCGVTNQLPPATDTTNIRDSIAIHYVDSTVIIPVERIVDIVPQYDTLIMETSMAKSTSYVDTLTHTIKGKLENKKGIEYKYIYKDRIEYRDSIHVVKEPYPVEVEKIVHKHYWYESILWFFTVLALLFIAWKVIKIYIKV